MLASLKAGQDFENPAFACTFFSQAEAPRKGEAPPTVLQLLFECTNPRDCSIAGSETNCASATPWTGTWAGNLKSGKKRYTWFTLLGDANVNCFHRTERKRHWHCSGRYARRAISPSDIFTKLREKFAVGFDLCYEWFLKDGPCPCGCTRSMSLAHES